MRLPMSSSRYPGTLLKEAAHTGVYAALNLNLWRDWMPPEIESLLHDKPIGIAGPLHLAQGTLIPEAGLREVLKYFLKDGRFRNLNTFSLTGLPRPEDDKYASQMQWSDPIYSVWGELA